MFLGDLSHHSLVRRISHPNASRLRGKACTNSRIGRITQLRVHSSPPFIIDSVILFVSLLTVEHGTSGTSSSNTETSSKK